MCPVARRINKSFFKQWSNDMAYVLGFFAADGYMWESIRGGFFFGFQINDKGLLLQIRDVLGSSHKIAERVRDNPNWNNSYRLQIGSKEMFDDLLQLGMTPVKSATLTLPKVPEKYLGSFIRGYFDGDGTVYLKEHFAKDRGKMRWVFQTRFTSGSKKFLIALHEKLQEKTVSGGYLYEKTRGYELVFSHRDGIALYSLMYHNAPTRLYLSRKKEVFEQAMQVL